MSVSQEKSNTVNNHRDQIVGLDRGPELPFPLRIGGQVLRGFGRGSKELGVPTANIPVDSSSAKPWIGTAKSGVYFGWCSICFPLDHPALISSSSIPSSRILAPEFVPPSPGLQLSEESLSKGWRLYPTVMSIGFNPYFKNKIRSAEAHVMAGFEENFYGSQIRVCLLGFIREEKDYICLENLIEDIKIDCEVAGRSLARPNWTLSSKIWEKEVQWLNGHGET